MCCILAVIISSCNKENEIVPISSSEDTTESRKRNDDFFSNQKTFERLSKAAHNWNKTSQVVLRSENEDVDDLKNHVDDLDIFLNDKYVNRIIADEGYPFWDASKVYLLNNGGSIVFVPIFKENSDRINAIFVYSDFGTNESSYIIMTREEMEVISSDPKDPNFHLLNKIYKNFDNELFALDLPQYDDWAGIVLAVDYGCSLQLGIASDGLNDFTYIVCSSGCTNDLWSSGIVDEDEEIASWIKGNCLKASIIDDYLQSNGIGNSNVILAAEVILEITITFDASCIEDRTVIELIKTFLHEGIHAEIFRIVKSIGGYENLNPENYPEIWEAYRTHEEWSHEFMANWYLEKLADSLAEIDANLFSTEHYIALAWQGLGENPNDANHPISIRWQNLSLSEQQTILTLREELITGSNLSCP